MKMNIIIFTTAVFLVTSLHLSAQKSRKFKLNALPVVFFSPETNLGFGGLVNTNFYMQDSTYRPSNLLLGGAYTLEKQLLLYLPFELNWHQNDHIVRGEIGYYRYFYNFYGIGPEDSPDFEVYTVNFPRFQLNALKRVNGFHYLGFRYFFDDYQIQTLDPEGQLFNEAVAGFQGSLISTFGLIYTYDSRDNNFSATRGQFISVFADVNNAYTGSNFNFRRLSFDATAYFKVAKEQILAINLFGGMVRGEVPFQELMLYGGPKKARGYYLGRLRDKNLLMFQGEYRFQIYRRFGAVIFGTLGNVSPEISTFEWDSPKYNLGLGLRYMINPADRLNVRLDYAIGKETSGFYITFGEAF